MSAPDLRGFHWPLAALQRKFDLSLESARLRLARLRQQEAALQRTLDAFEAQHRQTLAGMGNANNASFDPAERLRSLDHLVQQAGLLEVKREEMQGLRSRLHSARDACAAAERQRACVERMRTAALRVYGTGQLRAATREADFAWLVLRESEAAREESGP